MSTDANSISPARFAAALRDLPSSSLHSKLVEVRGSISHLHYSNSQLEPFANATPPDPVCVEAIRENERVIERMRDRIRMVFEEADRRGVDFDQWDEPEISAESANEVITFLRMVANQAAGGTFQPGAAGNATGGHGQHPAWSDGTFTVGTTSVQADAGAGTQTETQANAEAGSGDAQARPAQDKETTGIHL